MRNVGPASFENLKRSIQRFLEHMLHCIIPAVTAHIRFRTASPPLTGRSTQDAGGYTWID